jgi:hypothetical protein
MQTNNRKSQYSIPAALLPHLAKGLTRHAKAAFGHEEQSAKQMLARVQQLTHKQADIHRMRLSNAEAASCHLGLLCQHEWLHGASEIPLILEEGIAYFKAAATGKELPRFSKPAPEATSATHMTSEQVIESAVAPQTETPAESPTLATETASV